MSSNDKNQIMNTYINIEMICILFSIKLQFFKHLDKMFIMAKVQKKKNCSSLKSFVYFVHRMCSI